MISRIKARERDKKYREKNKAKRYLKYRTYILDNPDKRSKYNKRWKESNKEKCREISRNASQRRRARKLELFIENVDSTKRYELDQGMCGICGEFVEIDDFHIDHIIPLSRGGEHSYSNTQVAHPLCNIRKSDKIV